MLWLLSPKLSICNLLCDSKVGTLQIPVLLYQLLLISVCQSGPLWGQSREKRLTPFSLSVPWVCSPFLRTSSSSACNTAEAIASWAAVMASVQFPTILITLLDSPHHQTAPCLDLGPRSPRLSCRLRDTSTNGGN